MAGSPDLSTHSFGFLAALSLLDHLRAIGKRPGFYVGDFPRNRYSIWHLRAFIVGYQCARQPPVCGDEILDALTFWVCARFGVTAGSLDWAGHLWRQSAEDDEAAFKLFFELLEDYIKEREKIGLDGIKARYMLLEQGAHENAK